MAVKVARSAGHCSKQYELSPGYLDHRAKLQLKLSYANIFSFVTADKGPMLCVCMCLQVASGQGAVQDRSWMNKGS